MVFVRTPKKEREMDTLIKVGLFVGTIALAVCFGAWILMLAAMVVHGYWAAFPAFSFLESVVLMLFVSVVLGAIRGGK